MNHIKAAERFATIAGTAAAKARDLERPRLANTPKRSRQAQEARLEALHCHRIAKAAIALARAYAQHGNVPLDLVNIKPVYKYLEGFCRSKISPGRGYYDAGYDLNSPYHDQDQTTLALWQFADLWEDGGKRAELEIRDLVDQVRFANIAGYFPTPPDLVRRMIDAADLQDGHHILEPSCGSGNILDGIREYRKQRNFSLTAIGLEINHTLQRICEKKGHAVAAATDFMTYRVIVPGFFERVIMNPPFESSQDIDHVQHAFNYHLKPYGRLVAIMSTGPFFRRDKKAAAFRQWFNDLAGDKTDIPAGAFRDSGTDIPTVMIELQKDP